MAASIRHFRTKFLKRKFASHLKNLEIKELITTAIYKRKLEILDQNIGILATIEGKEKME